MSPRLGRRQSLSSVLYCQAAEIRLYRASGVTVAMMAVPSWTAHIAYKKMCQSLPVLSRISGGARVILPSTTAQPDRIWLMKTASSVELVLGTDVEVVAAETVGDGREHDAKLQARRNLHV